MITIVDYGMGNLGSIRNMFEKIGVQSQITGDSEKINAAEKLILPGVGSFARAMENLQKRNLIDTLNQKALVEKIPVLGICLGMQLLANHSEEGNCIGLGWVDAEVIKFQFPFDPAWKVPHMGWNNVTDIRLDSLFMNMPNPEMRFYFVHSYYFKCNDSNDIIGETSYGSTFTSAVNHENISGVQFHPEKSHKFGMALLKNFSKL